ncbi:MAG: hypothetical protein KF878_09800 [Planctomycetes bacterium]|nr:hypothetical protein [Planctomycetota bacterium]
MLQDELMRLPMRVLESLTPPTDNLYKFMAICGLVLVVASLGAAALVVRPVFQAEGEWRASFVEYEAARDDFLHLSADWAAVVSQSRGRIESELSEVEADVAAIKSAELAGVSSESAALLTANAHVDSRVARLREMLTGLTSVDAQARSEVNDARARITPAASKALREGGVARAAASESLAILHACRVGGSIGGAMMCLGFLLWYRNLQAPQDELLLMSAGYAYDVRRGRWARVAGLMQEAATPRPQAAEARPTFAPRQPPTPTSSAT